jgi:hypothetical protein
MAIRAGGAETSAVFTSLVLGALTWGDSLNHRKMLNYSAIPGWLAFGYAEPGALGKTFNNPTPALAGNFLAGLHWKRQNLSGMSGNRRSDFREPV